MGRRKGRAVGGRAEETHKEIGIALISAFVGDQHARGAPMLRLREGRAGPVPHLILHCAGGPRPSLLGQRQPLEPVIQLADAVSGQAEAMHGVNLGAISGAWELVCGVRTKEIRRGCRQWQLRAGGRKRFKGARWRQRMPTRIMRQEGSVDALFL